jgi:signal transduction histidine kinase
MMPSSRITAVKAQGGAFLPIAQAATSRPLFAHLDVRSVLVLAFLLTAGTWLFAGSFFAKRLHEIEREANAIGQRYMNAQALLSDVRGEVYRASIYVRDALLDPDPQPDRYRADVEAAYRLADDLLSQYVPVLGSASEQERVQRLRRNVAELRDANLGVLSLNSERWQQDGGYLLITRLIPKREAAIQVASELQTLNRNAYVEQQNTTAALYRHIQDRFWRTFGLAVLVTLCIALLSAIHVHRVERRLRQEQEKDSRTADELQRLSAKLVSAQEEERRTIARELHDEIGQVLTVIKMELAHAQKHIAADGHGTDLLDDARSITDRALHAVRDISHFLHPPLLDDLGLSAAVDWYVQSINKRHELRVDFNAQDMTARLPPEIEVALYRIVQEGLTNVLRHARAHRCVVELARDRFSSRDSVRVSIRDDGVGFDPTAPRGETSPGLGLVGIRERVAQLGGELRLDSVPGRGTTLTAEFVVPGHSSASSVETAELAPREVRLNP